MSNDHTESVWITLAVIMIGIGSVVVLNLQPGDRAATTSSNAQAIPPITNTIESKTGEVRTVEQTTKLISSAVTEPSSVSSDIMVDAFMPTLTPSPMPVSSVTSIPPLLLPEVPVPENGKVYLLHPANPASVGWARANDEVANHFGDYNIFAGVFEGQQHVGAMQFDLSQIPPGSPILYADVTLTGLVSEYLGTDGVWTLQMLDEWMDTVWTERDFSWLAREDSGTVVLNDPVANAALEVGQSNVFSLPPEGLGLLEARLFTHSVSFRIIGPSEGPDNLFGWDSGFGTRSMGRAPVLRIVTGGPAVDAPPTPTPNYVVITPIPSDGYALLALAAERLTATAMATPHPLTGTPTPTDTPMPPNWVTPAIVTNTPTPENQVTASWWAEVATAQAIVRGTATATPPNVWTATSTPLPPPTPLIMAYDSFTPTPTPTTTPGAIPDFLRGKILFYSDRTGGETLMVMEPDGSNVNVWTGEAPEWIYAQAKNGESLAPTGDFQVVVSNDQISSLQLWTIDMKNGTRFQLTRFEDIAYDPVWSPVNNTIAFVSPDPGNDELFLINADGTGLTRLTTNEWEWDKHPSWSPDGTQLVFWSNRDTQRKQIWVMNSDGSNLRNLSNNEFNDWDPVWVK